LTVDEWIDPSLFKLKEFKEKDPELKPEAVNV